MVAFKRILLVLSLVSAAAWGQQNQAAPDSRQMNRMGEGMGRMMACMQNLDQQKLEAIGRRGQALQEELEALCADGRRDEAQSRAMEFGMEMAKSDTMQQLRQCGEMAQQMMAQMPDYARYYESSDAEGEARHVCDDI